MRATAVAVLVATLAACSRERPAPSEPPQLATVHRIVDETSAPGDSSLEHGRTVFLGSDARLALTSSRRYVPRLVCTPSGETTSFCEAGRPARLSATPFAILTILEPSVEPGLHAGNPQPAGTGDVSASSTPPRDEATPAPTAAGAAAGSILLPPDASTPLGEMTRRQILTAHAYGAPTLHQRTITSEPLIVPAAGILRLSIGIEEPAWRLDSAPVLFRVAFEADDGTTQDLFRRILDPAHKPVDRRWYDNDVDLSDLSGRKIRLRFITEPAQSGDERPSLPLWGDPRVLAAATGPKRPSIVLVSLDTLRTKSMSLYGYALETTPKLTALAARGTVFENVFTTFSNTLPSHMSMLTGLLPATHQVIDLPSVLGEQHLLLSEILRQAGFATAAFTEDALLDSRRGFSRGFSTYYENTSIEAGLGDSAQTFGRALAWAGRHADEPFFLFVHTYQVHFPYDPPPEYGSLFTGPDAARLGSGQRAYEQEIRYVDDVLQRLVDGLRRTVPDERLLLVVTADHGEEFLEHGLLTHNQLFDEVMHVPMLMVWPGHIAAGGRVTELASLIDLAPTLLQLVGVTAPSRLDGTSLVPLLQEPAGTLARDAVFGEYPPTPGTAEQFFVARSRDAKCIVTGSGTRDACYDLRADPGEHQARPPGDTEAFARLHAMARDYGERSLAARPRGAAKGAADRRGRAPSAPDRADPAAPVPAPDGAVENKMRALGYVQ